MLLGSLPTALWTWSCRRATWNHKPYNNQQFRSNSTFSNQVQMTIYFIFLNNMHLSLIWTQIYIVQVSKFNLHFLFQFMQEFPLHSRAGPSGGTFGTHDGPWQVLYSLLKVYIGPKRTCYHQNGLHVLHLRFPFFNEWLNGICSFYTLTHVSQQVVTEFWLLQKSFYISRSTSTTCLAPL